MTRWRKYRRVPDVKEARPVVEHQTVVTNHGPVEAEPGDYLVRDEDGEMWPVESEKFFSLYERADKPPLEGLE